MSVWSQQKSEIQQSLLNEEIDTTNINWVSTQGDGNCLFRAISYKIFGNENKHRIVRYLVAFYMRKYKQHWKDIFKISSLYKHYSKIIYNGTYGDHISMYIAAWLFNININVWSCHRNIKRASMWCLKVTETKQTLNIVQVGRYMVNEHFFVLEMDDKTNELCEQAFSYHDGKLFFKHLFNIYLIII